MLLELLRMYRIYWERYGDEEELLRIIRGIIQYFIREIQSSRELL
jgi:hypothetical protein